MSNEDKVVVSISFPDILLFWMIALWVIFGSLFFLKICDQDFSEHDCIRTCHALIADYVEDSRFGCVCEERDDLETEQEDQASRRFITTTGGE